MKKITLFITCIVSLWSYQAATKSDLTSSMPTANELKSLKPHLKSLLQPLMDALQSLNPKELGDVRDAVTHRLNKAQFLAVLPLYQASPRLKHYLETETPLVQEDRKIIDAIVRSQVLDTLLEKKDAILNDLPPTIQAKLKEVENSLQKLIIKGRSKAVILDIWQGIVTL